MQAPEKTRPPESYGGVFQSAFRIAFKNPILLLFGLLSGGGGGYSWGNRFHPGHEEMRDAIAHALVLLPLLSVLAIVGIAVAILARGSLITGTDRAGRGGRPGFRECLAGGLHAFWRQFGFTLVGLGFFLLLLIPLIPGIIHLVQHHVGIGALMLVLGGFLDLCLGTVFMLSFAYGARAVVLDGFGPLSGWRAGFRMFGDHPGRSIVLGVTFVMAWIVLGVMILIPILAMVAPLLPILLGQGTPLDFAAFVPALIVGVPILLVISAWVATFASAFWTMAYRWARPWPEPPAITETPPMPLAAPPPLPDPGYVPPPESGPAPA